MPNNIIEQQVEALMAHVDWYIEGKEGVYEDFQAAMKQEYVWMGKE